MLYFALFGACGWGFGGSMAYMVPLGYTHSGHLPTQIYGFLAVFLTGFLWASMGGAGTAYPAVEEQEKLTKLFTPMCWVLAIWTAHYFVEGHMAEWYLNVRQGAEALTGDFRQKDPFYWLDSDWIEACTALLALCLFDLWIGALPSSTCWCCWCAVVLVGWGVQELLVRTGWMTPLLAALVHPQGDPSAINPVTKLPFDPKDLVSNWPQVFFDLGRHLGWIFGLVAGIGVYFTCYGKWRSVALLPMHLTLGGLIAFLVGPALLSNLFKDVGGFRLVPLRGDNWAMTLGVFIGMLIYMLRNKLAPVAFASIVAGVVGGLGLMVAQFVKLLANMPGNPALTGDPAVQKAWSHWRSANWHSILTEQSVGLLYGLGIVLAMAMLARRKVRPHSDHPRFRRWTQAFSVVFILNMLVYVNLVKNVAEWTALRKGVFQAVPKLMTPPLFNIGPYSAYAWFTSIFLLITIATIILLAVHLRKPLAVVPSSWLGRGQMVYLAFLWVMVIGNFERRGRFQRTASGHGRNALRQCRARHVANSVFYAGTRADAQFDRTSKIRPAHDRLRRRWDGNHAAVHGVVHGRGPQALRRAPRRLGRGQPPHGSERRLAHAPDPEIEATPITCFPPAACHCLLASSVGGQPEHCDTASAKQWHTVVLVVGVAGRFGLQTLPLGDLRKWVIDRHRDHQRDDSPDGPSPVAAASQVVSDDRRRGPWYRHPRPLDQIPIHQQIRTSGQDQVHRT